MSNEEKKEEAELVFTRPTEQDRRANPVDDQNAYFAYWEMKRRLESNRPKRSKGIYEDARAKYRSKRDDW
jgi:hypothetical protein